MKTEQPLLITSILCIDNNGIFKNRFVTFEGSYGREGSKSLGVCNADTSFNEMMPVMVKGIALVIAADSIGLGEPVECFDDGAAKSYDGGNIEGYALDASNGGNELIRILLV